LAADLLRLGHQRNDSFGLVLGHYASGRNLFFGGRFTSSRSHLDEAIARYGPISHQSLAYQAAVHLEIFSRVFLGIVLFCLGYADQALAQSNAAIAGARELAHAPARLYPASDSSLVPITKALNEKRYSTNSTVLV
jgi:hypothetical protein